MQSFYTFCAKLVLIFGLLLHFGPNDVHSIGWLSLLKTSSIASINSVELCDSLIGLNKKQKQICKKNIEVMDSVRTGANRAITECQHQFQERRWNCTSLHKKKIFGKLLNEGTRESAFIHAISSAGIAFAVTKYCSDGQLSKCGCDRTIAMTPAMGFQWAGCSDNIAFGIAFAKTFVDSRDLKSARSQKSDSNPYERARALMNLHNNEAGRKVINNNMKIECKCHGVSGSCELKTCWRSMPSFRQIGNILKDKFDSATEVQLKVPTDLPVTKPGSKMEAASMTSESHIKKSGRVRPYLAPINNFKPQTDTDLIYLHSSPDFCERNEKIGSLGTHGRQCNRTSKAIDGCELMCCGRGYKTRIEKVEDRCNCKFHWCCYVECDRCWKEIEINTCL